MWLMVGATFRPIVFDDDGRSVSSGGSWDLDGKQTLTARGAPCPHCKRIQMRAAIHAELRMLVRNGQITQSQMDAACEGYCLGHAGEWIPDFIIKEER